MSEIQVSNLKPLINLTCMIPHRRAWNQVWRLTLKLRLSQIFKHALVFKGAFFFFFIPYSNTENLAPENIVYVPA